MIKGLKIICVLLPLSCLAQGVDTLIVNGLVYDGSKSPAKHVDVAISNDKIVAIGKNLKATYSAKHLVDAAGLVVAPGFIDPHTHSLFDLNSKTKSANLNYLTQGVTTVFNGNDGGGPWDIKKVIERLEVKGIGTNTALFVGHGTIRKKVMGLAKRHATATELSSMSKLVDNAMAEGAFGLSSGLYYVPGNYANTDEVITLAKVASQYGGIYDTHLRSESDIAAVEEALTIGKQANIAVHFAHLKALGKDSWGMSRAIVTKINDAIEQRQQVSADQYPWQASGTRVSNAVFPKWVMADSKAHFHRRLQDPKLKDKIYQQVTEKLRWRGGADSLLLVAGENKAWLGKTLKQVAEQLKVTPVEAAFTIVLAGDFRVASFNMALEDINYLMTQPWVMTSSDGTTGHPRKYASFPQKYQQFVKLQSVISESDFFHRSTGLTADTFKLENRGYLKPGYAADVQVIDLDNYKAHADFSNPAVLTTGIKHLWVNGQLTLSNGDYLGTKAGIVLKLKRANND
jgi:N-acyl-D-amino-acid deacylase